MSSCPVLHFYQVPSKYSEGHSSYRADKKSISNKTKGDNSKSKKGRVVIVTCRLVLFYISIRYHQNILKGIPVTEQTRNLFQTKQREITPKVKKPDLSFLYVTCGLVLFYICTKYHKNIPKGL